MLKDINNLSLPELMDALVDDTRKLLKEMHQKGSNGITIRDMKTELQLIQKAIENIKANKLKIA